ncbi:MAG: phenylacetate--CoA ligase [Thermoprotei archaeon]|nr:MAG: phenylacetate--CoA ligase [Thermoprotei archaeon]
MKFWSKEESLNLNEIKNLQRKLFRKTILRATKTRLYREKTKHLNLADFDLNNIDKLPFTSKDDLRKHYPYGALAVPLNKVVRVHSSSGTLGKPVLTFYTKSDLEKWYNLLARNLWAIGVRPGDIFQNTVSHGLFTGIGYLFGAERLGCTVIPYGPAGAEKQLKAMVELGVTVFHAVPSFALKLADLAEEWSLKNGRDLRLSLAIIGAEFWSEHSRKRIENALGIEAYNNYGLAEVCGPGVAVETPEHKGLMHVWADHFYIEVIDPKTGENVDEGEEGELVMTTLQREAMPLIRYRTGDIVKLIGYDCGLRPGHPLISWIKGRVDDMVKVKGVGLYPESVERIVMKYHELRPDYLIVLTGYDKVKVLIETKKNITEKRVNDIVEEIRRKLKEETFIRISVEVVEQGKIDKIRGTGKVKRILDLRKL